MRRIVAACSLGVGVCVALACGVDVERAPGITGSTNGTSSTSPGGTGGVPIPDDAGPPMEAGLDAGPPDDAGMDASPPDDGGPLMCQDPGPLAMGALGPATCDCPCGMEAPANLMMMAQAAVDAYHATGALCTTAVPVPFVVPPGKCYQPNHFGQDMDFFEGDMVSGWKCLDVGPALTAPIHCSYSYQAGSGYLAPPLGGPDPGTMGFEVAAQGDVDADGVYSTFAIAGTFDPATGTFSLSPVFQHQPDE